MTFVHGASGSNLGRIIMYYSFTLDLTFFGPMLKSYVVVNTVIFAIVTY
jgi:hypothetical protein